MKALIPFLVFAVVGGFGCGRTEPVARPVPVVQPPPTQATTPEGTAVEPTAFPPAKDAAETYMEPKDVYALNGILLKFLAEQSRAPVSLQELVVRKYLRQIPPPPPGQRFVYDREGVAVKVVAE